jgi:hypothetical protein
MNSWVNRRGTVILSQQSDCPFCLKFSKTDIRHAFFAIHTAVTDIGKIAMETVFRYRQNRFGSNQHAVYQQISGSSTFFAEAKT